MFLCVIVLFVYSAFSNRRFFLTSGIRAIEVCSETLGSFCRKKMSSYKFDIEKFNGSNDFTLWKLKMKAILVQQKCEEAIEGEEKLPVELTAAQKAEAVKRAHSAILLSLADEVLREVADETTAAGLWKKLESRYQKRSLSNKLYQKRRLHTLKMSEGMQVTEHLDKFNRIVLDLRGVGVDIDDEDQAMFLLHSLPDSYESFVDTIMYGRDGISVNDVKDALLSKELKRLTSSSGGDRVESGLTVSRGKGMGKNHGLRCYHCKEIGHVKKNCPHRRNGENSRATIVQNNSVGIQDNSDEGESSEVLTVSACRSEDSWVIDTGAAYHMTFSRKLFDSFKEWKGSVKLGDGEKLSVEGSGSLKIRMHDGMVRKLDAWYVPGLRRNLISVGALAKHGYSFSGRGGGIRVCKGSSVVMKGRLRNGIYTLIGNSVIANDLRTVVSSAGKRVEFVIETLEQEKINQVDSQGLTTSEPGHGYCVDDEQRPSLDDTRNMRSVGLLGVNGKLASGGKSGLDLVRCCRT